MQRFGLGPKDPHGCWAPKVVRGTMQRADKQVHSGSGYPITMVMPSMSSSGDVSASIRAKKSSIPGSVYKCCHMGNINDHMQPKPSHG